MLKIPFTVLCCMIGSFCSAQRYTAEEYIEQFKDVAIVEMKRTGVPAAVTLAQGLLETENGNSELVRRSNNHFGIKCKNTWTGASVNHDDDVKGECFRSYKSAAESFKDHSDFLQSNTRYGSLFRLDVKDYKGWAYGLKRAGYATNPRYPEILINNIEQFNLQQYTLIALQESPGADSLLLVSKRPSDGTGRTNSNPTGVDSLHVLPGNAPDRVLLINRIKCVAAKKGNSLLALAIKFNINLSRLLDFNDLAGDGLLAQDQYIFLQRKSTTGEKDFYTVLPGETLYDIAQKNGITLQSLAEYNLLFANDKIKPGTKLFLKPGLKMVEIEEPVTPAVKMHGVKSKEIKNNQSDDRSKQ